MKMLLHVATIIAAAALFIISYPLDAHAQTQCPVGTAAGSATCGPDPQSGGGYEAAPTGPRVIRERLNGLGGFAMNLDTKEIIHWSGYGEDMEEANIATLEKCQQPNYSRGLSMAPPSEPDANCGVMFYWRNACAASARGMVDGQDLYYHAVARNAREARAKTLSECQKSATDCMIVFDARCVSASVRTRAPYDYEIGYRR